jgi:hypothetical protein
MGTIRKTKSFREKFMTSWRSPWAAAALATSLLLQACGSDSPNTAVQSLPTAQAQALRGRVLSTAGVPLAKAQITWGSLIATTDAQGHFEFAAAASMDEALQVTSAGYAPGVLRLANATTQDVVVVLSNQATQQSIDVTLGGTVTAPSSSAQVALPAGGLIVESTGQPATGTATIGLTPINPAQRSSAMPGAYLVATGTGVAPIESFGAIHVSLQDAQGHKLNLAPNKTATIRIPVASRSSHPPAEIPLLYLNESTGIWQEQGKAKLVGSAPSWYYEGVVSHFSYWNADQTIETVTVSGCLVDSVGQPVSGAAVSTDGVDYTGGSNAITDAQGQFAIAMRRNSTALLYLLSTEVGVISEQLGPYASDKKLSTCFKLNPASASVKIIKQPIDATVTDGFAIFNVVATGPGVLTYQWQINGVNTPYYAGYTTFIALSGDVKSGDKIRVIVSNATATSQETSSEAVVTFPVATPPVPVQPPVVPPVVTPDPTTPVLVTPSTPSAPTNTNVPGTSALLSQLLNPSTIESWGLQDLIGAVMDTGNIQSACTSGSITATLDGQSKFAASALTPDATHTLAASFNQCDTDGNGVISGKLNSSFKYKLALGSNGVPSNFGVTAQSTMTDLSAGDGDTTTVLNGRFDSSSQFQVTGASTSVTLTVSPQKDATALLPSSLGLATFNGGSLSMMSAISGQVSTSSMSYDALSVTLGGKTYLMTGTLTTAVNLSTLPPRPTYSGEVLLKSGTTTVARVFANSTGTLMIEENGTQLSFAFQ